MPAFKASKSVSNHSASLYSVAKSVSVSQGLKSVYMFMYIHVHDMNKYVCMYVGVRVSVNVC